MPELTPGLEKIAVGYAYQIKTGIKTIDTIPATVPIIIKNRVAEIISDSET